MKSVFAITTTEEMITAEDGKATVVFTVTNTSSTRIRGIAKIKPLENTQRDWLTIEGKTERDFPENGTEQFTVNFAKSSDEIAVGESKEAEILPFRIDVISSINPDEDFTEGPTVNIEIPEQKADVKKSFPIWIPIVAGVLLLAIIGGVVGYLLTRESNVTVPNVIGMSYNDAVEKLSQNNLLAEKQELDFPRNGKLDVVFDQNPKEGEVEPNTKIVLKVPSTTTVPNVVGKTLNEATDILQKADLSIGDISIEKNNPSNKVTYQSPPAHNKKRVLKKTAVNLRLCIKPNNAGCFVFKPGIINLNELNINPTLKREIIKSVDKTNTLDQRFDTLRTPTKP